MCSQHFASQYKILLADPEGFEPSPAGSVPLTDLESAVVAVQLRVYEGLIRLSPKPYLPSKGILECIKQRRNFIGITHCIMIGAILLAECFQFGPISFLCFKVSLARSLNLVSHCLTLCGFLVLAFLGFSQSLFFLNPFKIFLFLCFKLRTLASISGVKDFV